MPASQLQRLEKLMFPNKKLTLDEYQLKLVDFFRLTFEKVADLAQPGLTVSLTRLDFTERSGKLQINGLVSIENVVVRFKTELLQGHLWDWRRRQTKQEFTLYNPMELSFPCDTEGKYSGVTTGRIKVFRSPSEPKVQYVKIDNQDTQPFYGAFLRHLKASLDK